MSTPTVLVIDDLPETGRMIAKYMSRSGITLCTAQTAEEGLQVVRSKKIDAILLDIDLGTYQEEGLDILRDLKEDRELKHIPVVMLSVFDTPETKVRAFKLGAEDYITKPFEPVVLRARMEAVLRGVYANRALKRSREKYLSLFQNSLVGIFRSSVSDGRLITCNDKALEIIGIKREEVRHTRLSDYYANPDDRGTLLSTIQEQGEVRDFVLELRRIDGSPVWVTLSARLFALEGYIEGVVTNVTEQVATQRKLDETERQYSMTFNQAAVGIGHVDLDGHWLRVNGKLCAITGYSEEELLLMQFQDITHPDDLAEDETNILHLLQGKTDSFSREKRCISKQGDVVWIQLTVSLVRNEGGNPKYLIAIIEDIRERKLVEHTLTQIVEGVSSRVGDSFFSSLVTHLGTALKVDYVYMGEYMEGSDSIRIRVCSPADMVPENFEFHIASSPAEEVISKGMIMCAEGASTRYPLARYLGTFGIEGYMGVGLYDSQGKPLGLIAIMSRTPMENMERKAALLKIFAVRAANELERKQGELALKTSEANLKALFDNALQGFLLIDSTMTIRAINKTSRLMAQKLWRKEVEEGDSIDAFIQPANLESFRNHLAVALTGRSIDLEWCLSAYNGMEYWFEFNFSPVLVDGVARGVCMSMLDITHRRKAVEQLARSEDRFRTLIEKSTDIITILDDDGVILYESPSIEAVLGYRPQELLGRHIFELFHPEDVEPMYGTFFSVMNESGTVAKSVCRIRHANGTWHYLEATSTNLLQNTNIGGIVINSRDITERVLADNERTELLKELGNKNTELQKTISELQETQTQLVQSERASAVGNLVAGVTHEINNPNAAIYGAIQDALQSCEVAKDYFLSLLAKEDQLSYEAKMMTGMIDGVGQTLTIAADGSERIKNIVSVLRSFTKHQEAAYQVGNLRTQIESTVTLFRYQFKNIEINCSFSSDSELSITGDLGEINQVFLNLFVNAAQAESTVINITAARDLTGAVTVTITDNGRGMNEETRLKIFEPFFTTRGAGNTGLGLNITRKIMERHQAHISVESEPGVGTTFILIFPAPSGKGTVMPVLVS
jgi:PAS domain S-box-containing protein